ncbi:glycosyltransferase family 10 domain-containing protein [Candidatus Planktophila dulcis]|uniref:glycosyltransferase family 10 domain-containing protein n=1 Tax=Candidatus Planktophila dulcis TaxID=1884914 RepID=UPI003BEEC6D1
MSVTVRFSDFWHTSRPTIDRFLIPLIESVYQNEILVENNPKKRVDLEVFSVFPPKRNLSRRALNRFSKFTFETSQLMEERVLYNSRKTMWFTGENKRAPIGNQFDTYLGFEPEGLIPNLHYLPLWVLNFDHFGKGTPHGFTSVLTTQDQLLLARKFKKIRKDKFCCAFLGNPTSFRVGILKNLIDIGPVGLYGSAFGNKVSDKSLVSSDYKFSFAFENNLYPGYITEKLLEAYLANTVPLYWGIDSSGYFNKDAFINFGEFNSLEEFVNIVRELNSDKDRYIATYEQPLLNHKFDIDGLVTKLRNDLL